MWDQKKPVLPAKEYGDFMEEKKTIETNNTETNNVDAKKENFLLNMYGGLNMSWPAVIILALATAVITTIFLVVPAFKNTSFVRMGETLEAWFFFAILIIVNSKKPLDAALKTFIFFLISQPLIYLFQVPFSTMGWGIFGYYRYWFILTLLTFPVAFIGWFMRKRNWLSLIIVFPALLFLALEGINLVKEMMAGNSHYVVAIIVCFAQVLIYLYVFTSNIIQKIIGLVIPVALSVVLLIANSGINITVVRTLPDEPVLSEEAIVNTDNTSIVAAELVDYDEGSAVRLSIHDYGSVNMTVQDGDTVYEYVVTVNKDSTGSADVEISEK